MAKEIILSRGKTAIVDDADFAILSIHKWSYHNKGYAYRMVRSGGSHKTRTSRAIMMHRAIIGPTPEFNGQIDHIDGNGLNNQRGNLRLGSHSINHANGLRKPGKSGIRGVVRDRNLWRARITCNKEQKHLGVFKNLEDAVDARRKAELELFGQLCPQESPSK